VTSPAFSRAALPPGADLSRGLGIDLSYGVKHINDQPLWLPQRLKPRIVTPDELKIQKTIYFKGCLFGREGEWYGGRRRCHYNLDIDEAGADGLSARDQIHIYLTGLLERVSQGRWIYQDSDERWGTTIIEEWPVFQDTDTQWARFWRRMK
jgi:hypothetical protein